MFSGIVLLLGGLITLSGKIIKKKPSLKEHLDKLLSVQGYIGILLLIRGIIDLFTSFDVMGPILKTDPVIGIILILVIITEIALGFLLGYSLIVKHAISKVGKNTQKKSETVKNKLLTYQSTLGVLAIIFGILALIGEFL